MRICIIGKFPPIQGGVSMRTYWTRARAGGARPRCSRRDQRQGGAPPFRMHMRAEDWERCEAIYGAGSVTVHWTDPVDRSQSYIPMASPFVSKLAAIAANVHAERPVRRHLLPLSGALRGRGHLRAQMTGVPHVVRMAGSDAGRLWHHPQFEALYDHVLRSAAIVIAAGIVAERAVNRGVDPSRIALGGGFVVPEDLFCRQGPSSILRRCARRSSWTSPVGDLLWGEFAADRPYFGIYGKLGDTKGSFALLEALRRLKRDGLDVGLVALAHGQPDVEKRFRARADRARPRRPHLADSVSSRIGASPISCAAASPSAVSSRTSRSTFHSPIIPLEVLLCGTCLSRLDRSDEEAPRLRQLAAPLRLRRDPGRERRRRAGGRLAAIVRNPEPSIAVGHAAASSRWNCRTA